MKVSGKATLEGTTRYKERHQKTCAVDHFREGNGIITSSIGIGTHLGESDEQTDSLVTEAIIESVRQGINLIDSAIVYRDRQGERSVQKAINYLINSGEVSRDELIICTKGGFLPHETPEYFDWFCQHYVEPSNSTISREDIVVTKEQEYHCIHPDYLNEQINQSLENLGLETIDIYYIHNPETQLFQVDTETFYNRLRLAFEVMEDAVNRGKIAAYGLATWDGFRVPETSQKHLDLAKIKSIAKEVSSNKEDSLRYIQFPLNMGMTEAFLIPTQNIKGERLSILESAKRLGLFSIASASLYQAEVIGRIPENIVSTFGKTFETDCQRALQYARSTPELLTALVGMKNPQHVKENLSLNTYSPFKKKRFQEITDLIIQVTQRN
ncbi:MAG: aldo/keto reductase [Hydrococcus sp. Prado102]|jgi:aryl-alcohol dehydrogenase-like predicted oxidoreductase|nr:aldo/keto reductase [Hydrococcus sp. Prado102]